MRIDQGPWPTPFVVRAARNLVLVTSRPCPLPPVAEASTDLTVRKAPVLFGWAGQGRAKHDLWPGGGPTQRAGAVKSGGTRAPGREEPDFSIEGWRGTRH